jgi:ribosomal protein S12 methylthiotransferase
LIEVIRELERIEGLKWIRLMYLNPSGISDSLIEAIAESSKVVHYVDMPIQHINDRILRQMCRPDTRQKITELIERLRKNIPDIVLRTTVIVGFPGETDEEFEELVDFVKRVRFDALGCFTFWSEEGTKAAKLPGQLEHRLKGTRRQELMLVQQEIVFEKNRLLAGRVVECLIDERRSGRKAIGRFYGQAPHIDSVCFIDNCADPPGSFIKAEITGFEGYDLLAKRI